MPNILAIAEARGGDLRRAAYESITAARALANGGEVHAVVFGPPGMAAKAPDLARYGASVVFVCEHEAFARYAPECMAATIAQLITKGRYRAAIFAASAHGKDLGPRTAAKLRVPIATDVTSAKSPPRSNSNGTCVWHKRCYCWRLSGLLYTMQYLWVAISDPS